MVWLKNFKTKAAIPATQLKWVEDDTDTQSVADVINGKMSRSDLLDMVYPVGSIYMSVNTTNPATLFGGTWEQMKDRFLLGAGDTYTLGRTGGEAAHTLTVAEMPAHAHGIGYGTNTVGGSASMPTIGTTQTSNSTSSTGGGSAHNNMPPFIVVLMWKRTA
jgi:hypothetical protein